MKKLLALVLALVMTLSLCVTSNAAFTDAKDVDADFEEAVAVLSGMGVFKGYEDGSFKPEGSITRAEVAAIVYRLYTGDVKDKQAGLYAGYGKFDDMAGAQWAAGYVGFCANAGFVKGYGNGKFGPSDPVTGYQALAMILRAVGYGQNGEFEGADWELHVAQVAQQLKVLKNVKNTTLKTAASRQLVAELLFQVAAYVDTVTYTPAFGYVSDKFTADGKDIETETLGEKNFDLTKVEDQADAWGRPCYKWTNGKSGDKKVTYATIKDKPVATYTEAVAQCDVYDDLDLSKDNNKGLAFVLNGKDAAKVTVEDKSAKADFTKQGRLVEIYDVTGEKDNYDQFKIVAIDTYLAKVGTVLELKLDKNDHVERDASLTMTVYSSKAGKTVKLTDDEANFEYEKDDMVLVNINEDDVNDSVILGVADTVEGKATKFSGTKNNAADTVFVGDEEYAIAFKYFFDECGKDGKSTYTWYVDQYGNVIGNELLKTVYSYAVLKNLTWVPAKAGGHAVADLIYFDGTVEEDVVVDTIDGFDYYDNGLVDDAEPFIGDDCGDGYFDYEDGRAYVTNEGKLNGEYDGYAMYRVDTDEDGEVTLDMFETTTSFFGPKVEHLFKWAADGSIDLDNGKMTGKAYAPGVSYDSTSGKVAVADEDTKFIYCDYDEDEEEYVFTAYTLEDLPEFVDGTVYFMAKVDDDGVAEYVYIQEAVEAGDQYDYFMPTSDVWTYDAKEKTYTITGILDGEEKQEVTFDADVWGVAQLTVEDKTNAVGKLFKIVTDDEGNVGTAMILVNNQTEGKGNVAYGYYVFDANAKLQNSGKLYVCNNGDFNITADTVVLGTKDMTLAEAVDVNTDTDPDNDVGIWFVVDEDDDDGEDVEYVYIGKKLATTANVTVDVTPWLVKETKTDFFGNTVFVLKDDVNLAQVFATATVDNGGYFGSYNPFFSQTVTFQGGDTWYDNFEYYTEDGNTHKAWYRIDDGTDMIELDIADLPESIASVTVKDADGNEVTEGPNKLVAGATYTVVVEAKEGYNVADDDAVTVEAANTIAVTTVETGKYTFVAPNTDAVKVTVTANDAEEQTMTYTVKFVEDGVVKASKQYNKTYSKNSDYNGAVGADGKFTVKAEKTFAELSAAGKALEGFKLVSEATQKVPFEDKGTATVEFEVKEIVYYTVTFSQDNTTTVNGLKVYTDYGVEGVQAEVTKGSAVEDGTVLTLVFQNRAYTTTYTPTRYHHTAHSYTVTVNGAARASVPATTGASEQTTIANTYATVTVNVTVNDNMDIMVTTH